MLTNFHKLYTKNSAKIRLTVTKISKVKIKLISYNIIFIEGNKLKNNELKKFNM